MTIENLIRLKNSLEQTIANIDKIIQSNTSHSVLTLIDEGGYTEGYEHKDLVYLNSKIEDGELFLTFCCEELDEQ